MGAGDPSSGTASLHDTIRGLGALLKRGWKPLRTIVIASWDAEEVSLVFIVLCRDAWDLINVQYGLVGSTEWGEDFAEWIDKHVVAYLNLGECLLLQSSFIIISLHFPSLLNHSHANCIALHLYRWLRLRLPLLLPSLTPPRPPRPRDCPSRPTSYRSGKDALGC